jgi:GT2 family glycosyltransferase
LKGPNGELALSTIKVLAHIPTFNSAKVIEATIGAVCRQTYLIPEILLIDNASSDGTLERSFPDKVTIIRNKQNVGISGTVAAAMEYGLAHGYDWIYILDADSQPEPLAVENLIKCYLKLAPEAQEATWRLNSLARDAKSGAAHHGCLFTSRGIKPLNPPPEPSCYRCDTNIWSGSLFRLNAVSKVGVPNPDYVIDYDDTIYGYEGTMRGYQSLVDQSSVVRHHMHPFESLRLRRFGTRLVRVFDSPPMRRYYFWRNSTYFWLYRYKREYSLMPIVSHFFLLFRGLIKTALFIKQPGPALQASLRGTWDGLNGRLDIRF